MSGEAKTVKGGSGFKSKSSVKCEKCRRPGHGEATCRVRVFNYCKKIEHLENTCYSNPASPSYKGGPSQPSSSSVLPGMGSGTANFIDGGQLITSMMTS